MRRFLKSSVRRIKRFWGWFPIIWRDEDWDSAYLYEIMRYKISRIRKDITRCARHIGYQKDVEDMKIVEELLSRHSFSDFYIDNWRGTKELCNCKPNEDFFNVNEMGEWLNPFCEHCKLLMKKRHVKEKSDFNMIWDIMKKRSQKWWN